MIPYDYRVQNGEVTDAEFGQLNRMVALVAEKRRLTMPRLLKQPVISDTVTELNIPPWEHASAQRSAQKSVGFAYTGSGDIWIDGTRGKADQMTTMIHELAHVYQSSDAHGSQWRKFYGQVLTSWFQHKGMSYEDMRRQVEHVVFKYRKFRYRGHALGTVGAYAQYREGCVKEIAKIMKACPAMWTATADLW